MRPTIAMAVLLALPALARADEPPKPPPAPPPDAPAPEAKPATPPTPEQAADAVLAAVQSKDDAALKVLAGRDDPDPWLVANELIRRGELDAGEAFAQAAPRVDVEKLPEYVASRRGKPDDAGRRERLAKANAALAAKKPQEALDALGAAESGPIEDVVGVRLAMGRGRALRLLVRLDASAATFLAAGDAAERLGWLARAAREFRDSGASAYRSSAFSAAREVWERELSVRERRGDKQGAAATLGNVGIVHRSLGDYAKALATYERALGALEALGDKAGAARTLVNIGNVYVSLGDYAKALATYERARAALEGLGDKAGAAGTLVGIGNVYYSLGDYAKALATYERARAAQEALGDKAGAALTLGNIGNVRARLGDYAKALSTYERALAAKEALGDTAGAALTLGAIGVVHRALGDYAKALAAMERALAVQEALGDEAGAAVTLGNVGVVHDSLGDYAEALSTHERALAALEALGDKAGAARTLGNIGNVHARLGDYAKALSTYERALAAKEALGDEAGAALTLGNIGNVYDSLGDRATAIQFLERGVRAAEEIGANDLLVSALRSLAAVRLKSGDAGRAISDAHRAVSLLKTLVGGLGEEQGSTAREQYTGLFATGLAAASKAGDAPEAAFFLESGRAGTLLESLGARSALRAQVPEGLRAAEAQARAREARALVAYQKSVDGGDLTVTRARRGDLEAAQAGVIEVVERIQREAKRVAQVVYPVAAKVEDIQGFLAAGDALVLYGLGEKDAIAHALVLTKEGTRIVALGKSSEIVAACEALDATDRDADPATAIARLRDLVVNPLGLGKETKRLLVSPEGALCYVPFAALVPDLIVAYEPSGTTYGVLREEKDRRGEQVLALADADYGAKFDPIALDLYAPVAMAKAPATRGGRLASLPGTREEAKAIADVALYGKDASEPGLRDALVTRKDRWHSVHFACHGLVNPDRPTLSSLALTPAGEDDGFLTALEVLNMEIPSDLVVLSACETGKGKVVGGEGIVGLTRAFMYAGAPRVICSLWKVDDEATQALMTKFYELWNPRAGSAGAGTLSEPGAAPGESKGPGLPTAEALKQAQEFVRSQEKWKHPYYWAAWVLWGPPD